MAANYMNAGKVQVTYRHFAFIGPESQDAANASECAAEQQKFWEYAKIVFDRQAGENKGQFARANLKRWAGDVPGLDAAAFNTCFDANKHDLAVRTDTEEGRRRGVRATPTIYINGQVFKDPATALPAAIDRIAR